MALTKFEKEHRAHVEFRKNLAQRDAAKASIKQAEATQRIAKEAAKQTEYVKKTESLKQQEIFRKKEIEERISAIKKVIAKLKFEIADVDLLEGSNRAEKFLKINQEFIENASKYREELIELGESALIENFINFEKKLKAIRTSIYKNPKDANYVQLKENSNKLQDLITEKEVIENEILDLDNNIKDNISFKNIFSEKYCNVFNISIEEFKKIINEDKIKFPKSGFLIMIFRRLLLTFGICFILMYFTTVNEPQFQENIIVLYTITFLTFLIAVFVGRKTVKKRAEISKIEKEYIKFKANEERYEINSIDLEEKNNILNNLTRNINSVKKELEKLKEKAHKLGNILS